MCIARLSDMRDEDSVARMALRSVVASKQYGHEEWLAPLIAKACVSIVHSVDDVCKFNVDNIRTIKVDFSRIYSTFCLFLYLNIIF